MVNNMKIRKYKCIKQFPNTDFFSVGDIINIEKKENGEYVIDSTILTTGEIVYEYFELVNESGLKYAPYSFSRMESWVSCPKKFQYSYIIKPERIETENPVLEKGTLFHAVLEHDIIDNLDNFSLDDKFKALSAADIENIVTQALVFTDESKIYSDIKSLLGEKVPEKEIFLGNELKPVNDISLATIRGFIDLLVYDSENKTCHIYDWKTGGKSKADLMKWPKPKDQLELYAIWASQMYDIETIHTAFVYVEHDHMAKYSFTTKDIPLLKEKFTNRINSIESDKTFNKNLSRLCAWCDFRTLCLNIDGSRDPKDISKEEILALGTESKMKNKSSGKNTAFLNKLKSRND